MSSLKNKLKYFFIKIDALPLLDQINYLNARVRNASKNKQFKTSHSTFSIPPDYFLYESYRLDYEEYFNDGELAAKEIMEWTGPYLKEQINILEWGCGVARIIRHIPDLIAQKGRIHAVDINPEMIAWDKKNIPNVNFEQIRYLPPTRFPDHYFNLVFALSVFTHIEKNIQQDWIHEISRILEKNGIFLFTTHGKRYFQQLSASDQSRLSSDGSFTISYKKKGHRMMTTYNDPIHFRMLIESSFKVLEFYDGDEYPRKAGGQDLWIVQKLS
jgi:ubiquinone/menaquinone biosynthesis C-methylase UbiE